MKSTKFIFTLIFASLLCILSFVTVDNYSKLQETQYNFNRFVNSNIYDIQLSLFNIVEEKDSTYQFIQIDEAGHESHEIPYIYNELENKRLNFMSMIENDPNLQYVVKIDGQTVSNEFDIETDKLNENYHQFYAYIRFDENGTISYCSDNISQYFQNYNLGDFIYLEQTQASYFASEQFWINKDDVTFHFPKNTEFYILMPHKIIPTGYTYHVLTYYYEPFVYFITICTILALFVLSLLVLFTPIEKLKSINPYKTIKNWLFEWNVLIFGSLIPFVGFLAILLAKFTLDGTIEYLLKDSYHSLFFNILNYLIWLLFYYLLTILPFLIKYILTFGIFNYLKDYTILGRTLIKFKNEISNIQIGYKVVILTIIAFVIPAIIGILVMRLFADFGAFLIMLGYIGAFLLTLFVENKIYTQYKTLLEKTNQLSQGKFDIEINENLGLFEDYKKELLRVKEGFEKAVQEEIKSSKMKTELITNVSHDLKTPITCIKNYVTLLEDESLDNETQKEYIQNLHQYTNRLTYLVEDLFEVSKVNSGNVSLDLIELNIVDLIKQVIAENENIFTNSNLSVVTKFDDDHITCLLDGNKTYRIFENLITNIGKYALPYTRVYVDILKLKDEVQITFKNISKDEMNFTSEEIVERFVRGDKSRHEQGSGLGLAIVKSYTEVQNGTFNISVDGDLFKAVLTFKC